MNEPVDPLDELRAADPAAPERLPAASLARIQATMEHAIASRHERVARRDHAGLGVLGGAVAVAASIAILAVVIGDLASPGRPAPTGPAATIALASPSPTRSAPPSQTPALIPLPSSVVGPGIGMCVETYSLAALARRAVAFDGTVASISGDRVTFAVNEAYRGGAGTPVTLEAAGMTGTSVSPGGGPSLTVGERYLVAGEVGFAWGCGFTQRYDVAVAADWERTLDP